MALEKQHKTLSPDLLFTLVLVNFKGDHKPLPSVCKEKHTWRQEWQILPLPLAAVHPTYICHCLSSTSADGNNTIRASKRSKFSHVSQLRLVRETQEK